MLQLMFGHHRPHRRQLRHLVPHRLARRHRGQRRLAAAAVRRPMRRRPGPPAPAAPGRAGAADGPGCPPRRRPVGGAGGRGGAAGGSLDGGREELVEFCPSRASNSCTRACSRAFSARSAANSAHTTCSRASASSSVRGRRRRSPWPQCARPLPPCQALSFALPARATLRRRGLNAYVFCSGLGFAGRGSGWLPRSTARRPGTGYTPGLRRQVGSHCGGGGVDRADVGTLGPGTLGGIGGDGKPARWAGDTPAPAYRTSCLNAVIRASSSARISDSGIMGCRPPVRSQSARPPARRKRRGGCFLILRCGLPPVVRNDARRDAEQGRGYFGTIDEYSSRRTSLRCCGESWRGRAWAGEQVALGTATDCYQPAEARYRPDARAAGGAARARKPVGLVDEGAAGPARPGPARPLWPASTKVRVFFTITTVDPVLWRQVEPGTPDPRSGWRRCAA